MAELAARTGTAEIIEFHHNAKVDAPSGTATHTAERMAAASGEWADDPTSTRCTRCSGGIGPPASGCTGAHGGCGRQPGGHPRHHRADPDDPSRHRRSHLLHARSSRRREAGCRFPGVTIGLDLSRPLTRQHADVLDAQVARIACLRAHDARRHAGGRVLAAGSADARKASNEEIRTASESPALPVEDLLALVGAGQDVLDQTAVTATGRFLDEPGLLVANRTFDTEPGFGSWPRSSSMTAVSSW